LADIQEPKCYLPKFRTNDYMTLFKTHWRWLAAAWIAFVFIQSLFFKFSGSFETKHIFDTLGTFFGLPWFASTGAYIIGAFELVASCLLFSRFWAWGAVLSFEIMCGAIVFHLFTPLGIVMPNFDSTGNITGYDGGALFIMACLTCFCALTLIIKDWVSEISQIRAIIRRFDR
jgi:hypothetical protein